MFLKKKKNAYGVLFACCIKNVSLVPRRWLIKIFTLQLKEESLEYAPTEFIKDTLLAIVQPWMKLYWPYMYR